MINFREDEKIYLIKRRHRMVLWMEISPFITVFLVTIVLAIILSFVSFSWPAWLIDFVPGIAEINLRLFLLAIIPPFLLICWVSVFVIITHYYLDCWIVTNQRTIHTELKGFFNRTVSTVQHNRIQDITVETRGILPTFFRYGDLKIQTAGGFRDFVFRQIPEPYQTKDIIFKAQSAFLAKKNPNHD